jgi:hypothetical protein
MKYFCLQYMFLYKKKVLRNFKFYQTFKPRPSQNSATFFSKSLKTMFLNYLISFVRKYNF